jgi:guanosine-3',5'-bis(diphosphate) 3'-pyrophosphohydrolase
MRKDGVTPYVAHPFRVAFTVRHVFEVDDPVALCVALLHDVIEDTTTDFDDVCAEFGEEIAAAVACLTKDKRLPEDERVSENGDRHPTSCASTHLHPQHPGASPRFRTAS